MAEHYSGEIQGWFNFGDVYKAAVEGCPDGGTLVEVGCWKGKSLSFLLVEAMNSGKKLRICGVDHWKGSKDEDDLLAEAAKNDLFAICKDNCERCGYPVELWNMASPAAAKQFKDGSIDFCFIDASHDEESVTADILAWLPKVKPGGILAGHDRGYNGVDAAIKKCLPSFEEPGSCWLYRVPKAPEKPAPEKKGKKNERVATSG